MCCLWCKIVGDRKWKDETCDTWFLIYNKGSCTYKMGSKYSCTCRAVSDTLFDVIQTSHNWLVLSRHRCCARTQIPTYHTPWLKSPWFCSGASRAYTHLQMQTHGLWLIISQPSSGHDIAAWWLLLFGLCLFGFLHAVVLNDVASSSPRNLKSFSNTL